MPLHGFLDQPKLVVGTVAASALAAGDDFHPRRVVRHRRKPRHKPRSSWLRPVASRNGGHSKTVRALGSEKAEGALFRDLGTARREAVRYAGELLRDSDASFCDSEEWRLEPVWERQRNEGWLSRARGDSNRLSRPSWIADVDPDQPRGA